MQTCVAPCGCAGALWIWTAGFKNLVLQRPHLCGEQAVGYAACHLPASAGVHARAGRAGRQRATGGSRQQRQTWHRTHTGRLFSATNSSGTTGLSPALVLSPALGVQCLRTAPCCVYGLLLLLLLPPACFHGLWCTVMWYNIRLGRVSLSVGHTCRLTTRVRLYWMA